MLVDSSMPMARSLLRCACAVLTLCSVWEASAQTVPPVAASSARGVTQALRDAKLSMTVAGRIEGMLVREGSRVRQGQLLMHLDRTLEQLEVQRRSLQLDDKARLDELKQKEKTLTEQVESLRPLLLTGGVSRKQVEDEAGKERERVEVLLAKEAYERRHLRSPIDGVITKVMFRLGESIASHEAVISVVDTSRVRFMGTVPARLGLKLQVGAVVKIELGQDAQVHTRTARVVFVSPVTDPSSGLIELIAEFENTDGSVRPGISGRLLY
jgi:membrane fusion protein, multidrug efflux system